MSTTTKPSKANNKEECCAICIVVCVISAFVAFFIYLANSDKPVPVKYLTVAVESTAVRYYNVTPDGLVDSIIGVSIRAGNPDPQSPPLNLTSLKLLVKKDNRTIGGGDLPSVFNLTAGSEELIRGEAFGLVPVPERSGAVYPDVELAEAVRADLAAGEGIVDVELNGVLGEKIWVVATCEDVVIDCSGRSADRAQKVDCRLEGYPYGD